MIAKGLNAAGSACNESRPLFLSIVGPTASGKSSLAMKLAKKLNAELVNCDSVQVYRGFDIGSAKPCRDERELVPHHLLDCVSWDEEFDAARFASMARTCVESINQRGKLAIVVGGSGLYLRFLWGHMYHELPSDPKLREKLNAQDTATLYRQLSLLDPARAEQLHPKDKFRIGRAIEINLLSGKNVAELTKESSQPRFPPKGVLLIDRPRPELHERIAFRAGIMLEQGLIDEVRALLAGGCPASAKPMLSIGYRQVVEYLRKQEQDKTRLAEKITVATRQYAKRQMTWYRKVQADLVLNDTELTPQLMANIKKLIQ